MSVLMIGMSSCSAKGKERMTHVKYAMLLKIRLPENKTPMGKMFLIYFSLCITSARISSVSVPKVIAGEVCANTDGHINRIQSVHQRREHPQ